MLLIVEDNKKEISRAKEAMGQLRYLVAASLEDAMRVLDMVNISAVITDIHIPQDISPRRSSRLHEPVPAGLAVVAECTRRNIPVVVCSDIDHHFAGYAKVIVEVLGSLRGCSVPFIMDKKDWKKAVELLPSSALVPRSDNSVEILFVCDIPKAVADFCATLSDMGFTVYGTDFDEALSAFLDKNPRLVLTVGYPRTDGVQLVHRVLSNSLHEGQQLIRAGFDLGLSREYQLDLYLDSLLNPMAFKQKLRELLKQC